MSTALEPRRRPTGGPRGGDGRAAGGWPPGPRAGGAHRLPVEEPRHITPGSPPPDPRLLLEIAVLALIAGATVAFLAVFATGAWIRPTAGVVLVGLGVAAVTRRARIPFGLGLVVAGLALVLYLGVVFVPTTMLAGAVPTPRTIAALWSLGVEGLRLIPERASPTSVIPPLAFLAVAGTGVIAVIADLLVHAGRAPLKAVVVALTLWAVPLSMAPPRASVWPYAVPVLAAIALLLLAFAGADATRWGRWVHPRDRQGRSSGSGSSGMLTVGGVLTAVAAIVAGGVLAPDVPGFGEAPWLRLRPEGGSTLTANPIVQLRSNLVASGTDPIFTVRTPRPVYLRTTALDEYGEFEEWTTSGIRTRPLVDGRMARGTVDSAFEVDITVGEIGEAELVPIPYQPLQVSGEVARSFQFDPRTSTVALDIGASIAADDSYTVVTAVPSPEVSQLEAAGRRLPGDPLTALPANLPPEVGRLAREIVDTAGAETPFEQALAIQNELRSWEYSLEPPAGHDGSAMARFLENRVGYCEQFAGTMAVMLRTLDIPARVAVGFTPGRPVEAGADTYVVTWSNAHAWVEVQFGDLGWIAFEPTPRGDGNVLVPTPGDPSPAALAAEPVPVGDAGMPSTNAPLVQPGDDLPLADDVPRGQVGSGGSGGAAGSGSPVTAILVVAAVVAAGLGAVAWRRSTGGPPPDAPPADRVLAAGRRLQRIGAGLGVQRHAFETDREYLTRLSVGTGAAGAAQRLQTVLARARYAPSVDAADAVTAERAAEDLVSGLFGSMPRRRRLRVLARGTLRESVRDLHPRILRLLPGGR